jgi:predicted restriction endonuclease
MADQRAPRHIAGDSNLREATRQQLIQARVGQGVFRMNVLAKWNDHCALAGCDLKLLIRASHIVPRGKCDTNQERLDPENGLPLVATVYALFDRGLIFFDDDGNVLFSRGLSEAH